MKPINNKRKRAFALFLALAMCLGLLQTFAFADEGEGIFSAIAEVIAETTGAGATDAADAGNEPAPAAEPHTHNYLWEPGEYVMPTCKEGYRMWNGTCACGATATEKEPIAAIDPHSYGDNLPECAVCGKFNPDYRAPAVCEHVWENLTVTVPATCVVDGYEDYLNRCTLCGAQEVLLHRDFLAIGEHDYDDDHKCTVCGEVDPEYAKPDPETCDHDWSEWKKQATGASKNATCTEPGYYTERRVCSLCSAKDYQQIDTSATGHNYVDGVCTVCEAQEPAVEPEPHKHSWGAWVHQGTASYEATCTTAGLDVYIRLCNVCNAPDTEKLTDVIPAKGHSYVNGVCTACGGTDPDAPLPEPEFLVTCADGAQRVNAGGTAAWTVMLANNGDKEIQAVMSSNVPVYALYNGAAIRPQQYINIKPGTAGVLTVNYTTSKDTLSAVDDVVLTFVDSNSGISDGITLRYVVDGVEPGPVNPDPVNPDPVNPDPVNPDPVNPDPVNPDPVNPTPTPTPTPATPAPAPAAPAITAPAATAPAALTAPAAEEELDEDETPTADPEDEAVDEPETPTAAPEEDLDDPATPLAAPVETLGEIATPLAAPGRAGWAVLNLILMLCTGLASALLLLDPTGREYRSRSGMLRLASLAPAVVALVAFLLTENLRLPMALTDRWTLLMVLIALVQLAVCVVAKMVQNNESDGSAAARA